MSEPRFIKLDEAEEAMRKGLKELGAKWGKLWDESAEESKDALNDLGLLLIYLFMQLEDDSFIDQCFKMITSKVAQDIAQRSLLIARDIAEGD